MPTLKSLLVSAKLFAVSLIVVCSPTGRTLAQEPATEVLRIPVPSRNPTAIGDELNAATEKLQTATDTLKTTQRLADRGSASKARLSRAALEQRIAELELKSLQSPESSRQNQIEIASLHLQFVKQRFENSTRMLAHGSVSTMEHRRHEYSYKYAQLVLQAATGSISGEAAKLAIARLKTDLATLELNLARRLLRRRSIGKSTYDRLEQVWIEAAAVRDQLQAEFDSRQRNLENRFRT